MSDAIALPTAAAVGFTAGLTGSFLGISFPVLVGGFLAGIVVVAMTDGISAKKAVGKVLIALGTAAMFSDFLAIALSGRINIDSQTLKMPVAGAVGYLAQAVILPGFEGIGKWIFTKARKLIGQKIDEVGK